MEYFVSSSGKELHWVRVDLLPKDQSKHEAL